MQRNEWPRLVGCRWHRVATARATSHPSSRAIKHADTQAMLASTLAWWSMLTLPAWGMGLVLLTAKAMTGSARRLAPLVGALLVGFAMWWVEPALYAPLGDWLPKLMTALVRAVSWLSLLVWLTIYLVRAIGGWLRHEAANRAAAAAAVTRDDASH